jgi:hypothetical protein
VSQALRMALRLLLLWTDGDGPDDINREIYFAEAGGEPHPYPDDDLPDYEGDEFGWKFSAIKAILRDGREIGVRGGGGEGLRPHPIRRGEGHCVRTFHPCNTALPRPSLVGARGWHDTAGELLPRRKRDHAS